MTRFAFDTHKLSSASMPVMDTVLSIGVNPEHGSPQLIGTNMHVRTQSQMLSPCVILDLQRTIRCCNSQSHFAISDCGGSDVQSNRNLCHVLLPPLSLVRRSGMGDRVLSPRSTVRTTNRHSMKRSIVAVVKQDHRQEISTSRATTELQCRLP